MLDTGHQGRADLVPCGFGPINLPSTWLATDRRDHLPRRKSGDITGLVEK